MIKELQLLQFRNLKKKSLDFSGKMTIVLGPNASGKTNILEGLYLLSTGKSFKAKLETEIISYGKELARVKGKLVGPLELELIQTRGENGWPRKKLLVNGMPKRLIDFAGNFKVVLFGPWDLDLVTESPSLRRKFLDGVLSQVDREYRRSLLSYEKGLRQRNRLLWRIREEGLSRSQLLFWNQLLIKNGNYLSEKRREFIDFANSHRSLITDHYSLSYDPSAISEGRLAQYKDEEVAAATTLVGPHRDDFVFLERERDLAKYGSRGEQRMAVLWLKLAEVAFIEEKSGEKPTLLLDDIFSELDHNHREMVVEIAGVQQTVITTADMHHIAKIKKQKLKILEL